MEARSIFLSLSPLDHRYFLANRILFTELSRYMSEDAVITYCVKVETALLKEYVRRMFPGDTTLCDEIDRAAGTITGDEVYEEEEKVKHNIRALVNVMKKKVPERVSHLVHLAATSVDILDTAHSLRLRDAVRKVVLPLLAEVEEKLVFFAETEAGTPQVGRTHGQHAVPITFGFAAAEYVSRLGKSILEIERLSTTLKGKLAGAVGAYNAASMVVADPEELERAVLADLGLEPSETSTQLVEPEYVLRLLLELNTAFGIIANLADDLRHLQRSEIDEVQEFFSSSQVGSSTMPQKRNPWNSEHVKSLWKAFCPRVVTFYMDQISEHQRDLTNSASQRFISDYVAGFCAAAARMKQILETLHVDRDKLLSNLKSTGDLVLSEAAYILLSVEGVSDAHEIIRQVTLECRESGCTLLEGLKKRGEHWDLIRGAL
ncbi:MAG: adenylosuccinate lyase, partial [Spirochaetales bacterium]